MCIVSLLDNKNFTFIITDRETYYLKKIYKISVERGSKMLFASIVYSCKPRHRQREMKMEVQISAVLCSYTSPAMPNIIYSFLNSQIFFRRQASPLRLIMQLFSRKLLPPSVFLSFHFPPELHIIYRTIT